MFVYMSDKCHVMAISGIPDESPTDRSPMDKNPQKTKAPKTKNPKYLFNVF